jgi:hypothetical protein
MNNNKSAKGTMIPIETATKQNHNCPFRQSTFNKVAPSTPVASPAPAPKVVVATPAPTIDVSAIKAVVTAAVIEGNVTLKAQLDRIEQAIAGLLMSPTPSNETLADVLE